MLFHQNEAANSCPCSTHTMELSYIPPPDQLLWPRPSGKSKCSTNENSWRAPACSECSWPGPVEPGWTHLNHKGWKNEMSQNYSKLGYPQNGRLWCSKETRNAGSRDSRPFQRYEKNCEFRCVVARIGIRSIKNAWIIWRNTSSFNARTENIQNALCVCGCCDPHSTFLINQQNLCGVCVSYEYVYIYSIVLLWLLLKYLH